MTVQLHSSLRLHPKWKIVEDHANKLLVEYGFTEYDVFIRANSISSSEQDKLLDSTCTAYFDEEGRFLELVFGVDITTENFDFYDCDPETFAEFQIIDTLSQYIKNIKFPGPEEQRKRFRVIDGEKKD